MNLCALQPRRETRDAHEVQLADAFHAVVTSLQAEAATRRARRELELAFASSGQTCYVTWLEDRILNSAAVGRA